MSKLEEKVNNLSQILQDYLRSGDLTDTIQRIARKNNLHVDQMGQLADSVKLTLIGVYPRESFAEELIKLNDLTVEEAQAVTKDVNDQIFQPLQDEIKEETNVEKEPEETIEAEDEILAEISNPVPTPLKQQSAPRPTSLPKEPPLPAIHHEIPEIQESAITEDALPADAPIAPQGSVVFDKVMPQPTSSPVLVTEIPATSPTPSEPVLEKSVHEEKLGSHTLVDETESVEIRDPRIKMIPKDVKERINNDPYRESI